MNIELMNNKNKILEAKQKRIDELNPLIKDKTKQLKRMNNGLSGLNRNLEALGPAGAGLKEEREQIENNIKSHQDDLQKLESEFQGLQRQVKQIAGPVALSQYVDLTLTTYMMLTKYLSTGEYNPEDLEAVLEARNTYSNQHRQLNDSQGILDVFQDKEVVEILKSIK